MKLKETLEYTPSNGSPNARQSMPLFTVPPLNPLISPPICGAARSEHPKKNTQM